MESTQIVFNPLLYDIQLGEYHGKEVIWLKFPFEKDLILALRTHAKARWSPSHHAWHKMIDYEIIQNN